MSETEKRTPTLIAYHVTEGEKGFWTRIGAAWKHKDGIGFTLQLDLVPVTKGSIVLRPNDKAPEGQEAAA